MVHASLQYYIRSQIAPLHDSGWMGDASMVSYHPSGSASQFVAWLQCMLHDQVRTSMVVLSNADVVCTFTKDRAWGPYGDVLQYL